jgi:hypothetical protein
MLTNLGSPIVFTTVPFVRHCYLNRLISVPVDDSTSSYSIIMSGIQFWSWDHIVAYHENLLGPHLVDGFSISQDTMLTLM